MAARAPRIRNHKGGYRVNRLAEVAKHDSQVVGPYHQS